MCDGYLHKDRERERANVGTNMWMDVCVDGKEWERYVDWYTYRECVCGYGRYKDSVGEVKLYRYIDNVCREIYR